MRLQLVAVGKRMPGWVNDGFEEYNKRLPKGLQLQLTEVDPVTRSKSGSEQSIVREEERRIRAAIAQGALIVALDDKGKQITSLQLAQQIEGWQGMGRNVAFVIGGADGLDEEFKREADLLWSLSALTLPHALVRVVVAEQIYRAWTIIQNHPYHRE